MGSHATLLWGLLFSSIGTGYFVYGRKNRRAIALLAGILLCLEPYFLTGTALILLVGATLMALPYFVRY